MQAQKGIGFNKPPDLIAALAGASLYQNPTADLCSTLKKPLTNLDAKLLVGQVSHVNVLRAIQSRFGQNALGEWNAREHKSWSAFLEQNARLAKKVGPLTLIAQPNCPVCDQVASPANLQISPDGTVYFSKVLSAV